MTNQRRQLVMRGIIFLVLVALLFFFSRYIPQPFTVLVPAGEDLDNFEAIYSNTDKLSNFLQSLGPYSAAVFVLFQAFQVVISPIPGDVAGMVAGYLYGKTFGFLLSIIGTAFGSWIAFELARIFGRPFAERFVKREILEKFQFVTTDIGVIVCFIFFLFPYFPKDSLCYVLGLSRMSLSTFLIVSTVGRMPGTYVQVVVGATIQSEQYSQTIIMVVVIALVLFLAYLFRTRLFHRIKSSHGR
jgi:uncharacterized membrane protein YdjX (TVP38/TMEM64 family)